MRRWMIVTLLSVFAIAASGVVAYAQEDAGSASLTIRNVQNFDATYTGVGSKAVDVDCPSGGDVINGRGVLIETSSQSANGIAGVKLDGDTWRVVFGGLSLSNRYVMVVYATCLEGV